MGSCTGQLAAPSLAPLRGLGLQLRSASATGLIPKEHKIITARFVMRNRFEDEMLKITTETATFSIRNFVIRLLKWLKLIKFPKWLFTRCPICIRLVSVRSSHLPLGLLLVSGRSRLLCINICVSVELNKNSNFGSVCWPDGLISNVVGFRAFKSPPF